jgi:hypothetical protein
MSLNYRPCVRCGNTTWRTQPQYCTVCFAQAAGQIPIKPRKPAGMGPKRAPHKPRNPHYVPPTVGGASRTATPPPPPPAAPRRVDARHPFARQKSARELALEALTVFEAAIIQGAVERKLDDDRLKAWEQYQKIKAHAIGNPNAHEAANALRLALERAIRLAF